MRTTCSCLGIENNGHQAYIAHMSAMQLIVEALKNGETSSSLLGDLIIPVNLNVSLPTFTVKPDEDGKVDNGWIVSYTMNQRTIMKPKDPTRFNTLHIFQGLNSITYRWYPVS